MKNSSHILAFLISNHSTWFSILILIASNSFVFDRNVVLFSIFTFFHYLDPGFQTKVKLKKMKLQFSSVSSITQSCPTLCNLMNCQASLSITICRSSLKLMSIESMMPSSHLILCHPLFLLPPNPPSIRVFSNEAYKMIL